MDIRRIRGGGDHMKGGDHGHEPTRKTMAIKIEDEQF
jgi:hypothetical protein